MKKMPVPDESILTFYRTYIKKNFWDEKIEECHKI